MVRKGSMSMEQVVHGILVLTVVFFLVLGGSYFIYKLVLPLVGWGDTEEDTEYTLEKDSFNSIENALMVCANAPNNCICNSGEKLKLDEELSFKGLTSGGFAVISSKYGGKYFWEGEGISFSVIEKEGGCEIEYSDDGILLNTKGNIEYKFNGDYWEWRCKFIEFLGGNIFNRILYGNCVDFSSYRSVDSDSGLDKMIDVFPGLTRALRSKTFEEGIKIIVDTKNAQDDDELFVSFDGRKIIFNEKTTDTNDILDLCNGFYSFYEFPGLVLTKDSSKWQFRSVGVDPVIFNLELDPIKFYKFEKNGKNYMAFVDKGFSSGIRECGADKFGLELENVIIEDLSGNLVDNFEDGLNVPTGDLYRLKLLFNAKITSCDIKDSAGNVYDFELLGDNGCVLKSGNAIPVFWDELNLILNVKPADLENYEIYSSGIIIYNEEPQVGQVTSPNPSRGEDVSALFCELEHPFIGSQSYYFCLNSDEDLGKACSDFSWDRHSAFVAGKFSMFVGWDGYVSPIDSCTNVCRSEGVDESYCLNLEGSEVKSTDYLLGNRILYLSSELSKNYI